MSNFNSILRSLTGPNFGHTLHSSVLSSGLVYLSGVRSVRYASVAAVTVYTSLQFFYGDWGLFDFLVPSIHISETHELFPVICDWASREFKDSRRLAVVMHDPRRQEELEEQSNQLDRVHAGRRVLRYEPFDGKIWFKRDGYWFFLQRTRKDGGWLRGESEVFDIKTVHWTSKPLKSLLEAIRDESLAKEFSRTIVYTPRDAERYPGVWIEFGSRRTRDWESVILNSQRKSALDDDVHEFLTNRTRSYYAQKGITWSRGYLLHGPPGTGKTSLALALAGKYGLPVYIIPLSASGITDASLPTYLRTLHSPSMLLCEDIDSSDFALAQSQSQSQDPQVDTSKQNKRLVQGLTRSGFINAVDGITSPEGVLLVMTTNHLDKLDPAIIRPGRVDFQLEIPLATRDDAREMFMRMYSNFAITEGLADSFAEATQGNKLSGAQIQDFLIVSKDPQTACQRVHQWMDDISRQKQAAEPKEIRGSP